MRNPPWPRWGGLRLLSPHRSVTLSLRSAAPLALAALAFSLAACQDPSGVGLSLIGDETSDPNAQLVSASTLSFGDEQAVTGGFANGTGTPLQTRVLVGAMTDDRFGDVQATAYVDARSITQPADFGDRPLAQVQILLRRAETYGDTLASLPVEVRQIDPSPAWSPDGLPPDTTLATGDLLTTATLSPQDTLVTIDLPQSYIAANTVVLRDSLDSLFEGFQIRTASGSTPAGMTTGAVFGFNASQSSIRLIGADYDDDGETTRDTVDYPLVEVYTALARGDAMDTPGRMFLRGGASMPLALDFDISAFENLPLASAKIRVPLDRSLLDGPMGYNRPLPQTVVLYSVLEDGTRTPILSQAVEQDATEIVFRDNNLSNQSFNTLLQSVLLGRFAITGFEIGVPNNPLDLGVLPVIVEDAVEGDLRRPRLSLVTIGGPPA
ncbi:hypothetical protein BSZ36_04865 [Rubricoccus marinus]|uniref:DUF4270 domain-containing protein n=1 Tax=Rubricoccus marinus TaxID=716817 RepID=A0A259TXE4_9BACT|nr:hypothetical protein BSZ36_04865 [Rubricoccus marinus]